MRTCTACEVEKAESHYAKRGRRLSKVCKSCEADVDKLDTAIDTVAEAVAGEMAEVELVHIEPSMGARLKISGRLLEIEQDRTGEDGETYTHTVTLYPHEARQVIESISKFVEQPCQL